MNNEEWIVEVDENDKLRSRIERGIAHNERDPKIHREVMTLLYTDSSHKEFILQHRSIKKKQFPGLWTLSVTGHVDFADLSELDSDGYLTAARRETLEEIGVNITKARLVGKIIHKLPQNWSIMGIVVGEYKGEIKLAADEVSEVNIYNKDTIKEVSDKLTPGAKACLIYLGILHK